MLEVRNLSKTFKIPKKKKKNSNTVDPREDGRLFHAVRDVSFECKPGEILGVLGMNGAGKTTTLRMLATAIKPTSGTAVLDGVDVTVDPIAVRKRIGFLSGNTGLYGRLTAEEMITGFGKLHNMDKAAIKSRMDELFQLLDMTSFRDRRNESMSTGMKQKVSIVRTVIHDPAVIFFDEPTSGLDVLSSETIINFVRRCKDRGKTVVFSTHHMDEVKKLCDRVVVIHEGRAFFSGTPQEMISSSGFDNLEDAFKHLVRNGGDQ